MGMVLVLSSNDEALYTELLSSGLLARLPAHKLKHLSKVVSQERKIRFPRNHSTKRYGNINKGFTPEEFDRFMHHVTNQKARLAFLLEHNLGLRVGETVTLKIDQVDFLQRRIIIHTEKANTTDILPLHDGIFTILRDWVNQHHEAILRHDGYILYSDNPTLQRNHISKDWLRTYFNHVRDEAGLTQVYGMSYERNGRTPRRLVRLTGHSNRHSFGTALYRFCKDPKIVQSALRHTNSKSTDVYIHVAQDEVAAAVTGLFKREVPLDASLGTDLPRTN